MKARIPKAVQRWMADFEEDEEGLRSYLSGQREFYDSIPYKGADFVGWLCLKLSVGRRDAQIIYSWATGKRNDT